VVLTQQVLIERLLALVPRPRRHLVTYHGVLAPGASLRSRIVPRVADDDECEAVADDANTEAAQVVVAADTEGVGQPQRSRVPHRPGKKSNGRQRY